MKKLLFLLLLINGITFSQMKPGIDYMPHIGFFDFVVNYLSNPNDHLATQPAILSRYTTDNWYFDSLISLGLSNVVTDAQYHQNLNHTLDNFYLNDMGFAWKNDPSLNPPLNFLPARFMNSFGQKEGSYVMELGGENVLTISSQDNFGFAHPVEQASKSSYWILRSEHQPTGINSTGENGEDTQVQPHVYSRMALTNVDTPNEAIMWAQLPWSQFPLKDYIKIRIRLRRGEAPSGEAPVFTINATSTKRSPGTEYDQGERRDYFKLEVEPDAPPTLFQQDVIANELGNEYINKYDWFESNLISIGQGSNFEFNIIWSGNADLFIDKIMVYNYDYEALYVDRTVSIADIAADLKNRYSVGSISNDPYFQSFYFDEPSQLSAQFRGKLQDTISRIYASSQDFEINSAVGGAPKHFLDFDKEYAKSEEDTTIYKKYLLYNMYPIDKNTNIGTTSIQKRFDLFCNYNNVDDVMGSPYDPDRYKYVGLLNAQLAAKEANIPFVMTLGVHSEQYVKKNTNGSLSLVEGGLTRRPPTEDEIFAMGNLALAYGAKGFMYYMIPTRAGSPLNSGDQVWNTYGLFDEINKAFSLTDPTTWCQNPANQQVPNSRFYAVKEFIRSTKLIENKLLGLDWQSAHNWSRYPLESDWISDVSSWYRHIDTTDSWDQTFVETGNFKGDESESGSIEAPKYIYIVNRRCNIQPRNSLDNIYDYADTSYRYIKFNLNFPNSNWDYYTVKDLKTDSVYFATKTGAVTIFLGAGEGTLLKIEPQITSITQNDTLGYSTTFYSDLTVSNNATLSITEGATLTFENHSRLILSNGNLSVQGLAQEPVVFDFVTPYWQSTTNGIVNNYGNVILNHAKIKNAAVGYYSYITDNDDIQNCEIFNNYWGIVMHWTHSYGTEKAKIVNCNIHDNATWDNEGRGIYLSNSSPKIYATTIRKNDYGLYCVTNSNPYDTIDEVNGYNVIDSNDVGIISYNSTPMLGYVDDEQGGILISGGGNTIKNNSLFNVKAYSKSNIYVERNYWGTKDPSLFNIYSDDSSSIYTDYYLDDPPSGSIQSGLASKTSMKIDAEWMPPSQGKFTSGGQPNLLRAARRQIRLGNMTAARAILLPLINNTENMQMSCGALELYGKTYNPEDIESFFSVLLTVGNRPVKNDLTAKALFLLSEYQTDRKETHLTNLISVYQGTDHAARASYLKIIHLIGEGNPIEEIYALKNDMNRLYPLSSYTKEVNYLLVSGTNMMKPSTVTSTETLEFDYNLYNNYPNPFNPETVIKFSLKEKSNVTLDVYNIAGQKVAELVSGEMEKGMYEKRFNGTKFSSGVYIFRLNAHSLESTTNYTKTMKALLLK